MYVSTYYQIIIHLLVTKYLLLFKTYVTIYWTYTGHWVGARAEEYGRSKWYVLYVLDWQPYLLLFARHYCVIVIGTVLMLPCLMCWILNVSDYVMNNTACVSLSLCMCYIYILSYLISSRLLLLSLASSYLIIAFYISSHLILPHLISNLYY